MLLLSRCGVIVFIASVGGGNVSVNHPSSGSTVY
jgi:hypothetical protein